jgi:hypothetical protein
VELAAEVAFRRAGLNSYRVKVFDASRHGCKAEFVERPQLGETVWIKFDGLEALESIVRRTDGFLVGIEFIRPLHPAVFQSIVTKLGDD